jgi:TolB-like protein/Tfp pilus assembly protein PilF
VEPASVEKMDFALPDKPSIAVLAFDNLSGDPEQEYFCDGLSEEIITALSKVGELFVIARNSSFTYKGKPVKVQQISEELGVRYVLEGSVRKSGDRVRITAQLIDAINGQHLWAENYDRNLEDIFEIQDEITKKIITGMRVNLTEGEQARLFEKQFETLDGVLKHAQWLSLGRDGTKESILRQREVAQEIIDIEPDNSVGYRLMGWYHRFILDHGVSRKERKEHLEKGFMFGKKALEIDESNGLNHSLLGQMYFRMRKYEKAIESGKRAVELNPNGAEANNLYAHILYCAGHVDEAITYGRRAIRLNPFPTHYYYMTLGRAYMLKEEYENALKEYKKALQRAPENPWCHFDLATAYSFLGRDEEARASAANCMELAPYITVGMFSKPRCKVDKAWYNKYLDAMRKAGFPEHPPLPLPDKPSIAVLAFDNLSGDPEQEYFSDGIAENIITALSKVGELFVIARNSSFTYKGKPVKVQQVGRELGVSYVLEGSVQKSGDRMRITAQLIDAKSGQHLWAEKYDRNLEDIFEIQDEITKKIVSAMQVNLTEGEQARLFEKQFENLDAILKYMQILSLGSDGTKESTLRYGEVAQEIIDIEPDNPVGYRVMGWYHHTIISYGSSPKENLEKAFMFAKKTLEMDESDGFAHALLGSIYRKMGKHEKAIESGKRSVELQPNGAMVHSFYARILECAGHFDEAITYSKRAIRLDPFPPYYFYEFLGRAYAKKREYENALKEFKKMLQRAPESPWPHFHMAYTYSFLGRDEEARASAANCMELAPYITMGGLSKGDTCKVDKAHYNEFLDGMRKAGFPE